MHLKSYPSIFAMGHKAVADLLVGPVYVQEKVDGSQFSFGLDAEGNVVTRSKGAEIFLETADKLFKGAVEYVNSIKGRLIPGFTYRGEVLCKPKHNTLAYDRTPRHNVVIFDVNTSEETYLTYESMVQYADGLDLEVVPLLYTGMVESAEQLKAFLETQSFLGGTKIEGVVVKPVGYGLFGVDKKVLMAKFVSEQFKELHATTWKQGNPGTKDIIERIIDKYATQARWQKAVIHLREKGLITDAPQDIPVIMKEVVSDTMLDSVLDIQQELLDYAWPHVQRGLTRGLPEWYKKELLDKQFEIPSMDPVTGEEY
jgi:hypothetical protein